MKKKNKFAEARKVMKGYFVNDIDLEDSYRANIAMRLFDELPVDRIGNRQKRLKWSNERAKELMKLIFGY